MKKIIFLSDGQYLPKGAFEFVRQIQQTEKFLLTGAFLHAFNFEEFLPAAFAVYAGPAQDFLEEKQAESEANIKQFASLCERNGIEYRVHEESKNWNIRDLIKESRFADLLVMSEELFCTDINRSEPNSFMQQVIHKAECPVMLFPESFKGFSKVVIAYNGNKDSMFAMKQFCHLFPGYTTYETKIIYAKNEESNDIPDLPYLEEYAGRHFSDLGIVRLPFDGKKYFPSWLEEQKDVLVVSGAYSRSGVSDLFNKSFVEDIIKEHRSPLFIAHT